MARVIFRLNINRLLAVESVVSDVVSAKAFGKPDATLCFGSSHFAAHQPMRKKERELLIAGRNFPDREEGD